MLVPFFKLEYFFSYFFVQGPLIAFFKVNEEIGLIMIARDSPEPRRSRITWLGDRYYFIKMY